MWHWFHDISLHLYNIRCPWYCDKHVKQQSSSLIGSHASTWLKHTVGCGVKLMPFKNVNNLSFKTGGSHTSLLLLSLLHRKLFLKCICKLWEWGFCPSCGIVFSKSFFFCIFYLCIFSILYSFVLWFFCFCIFSLLYFHIF